MEIVRMQIISTNFHLSADIENTLRSTFPDVKFEITSLVNNYMRDFDNQMSVARGNAPN